MALFFSLSLVFSILEFKIAAIVFSLLMTVIFGGLSYLFYGLYRNPKFLDDFSFVENIADDNTVQQPINRVKKKRSKKKNGIKNGSVTPSEQYEFEYIDSTGQASNRRVFFRSVTFKNNRWYLNAIDQHKHAARTFRTDRIVELIDLESGEIINDAEEYFSRVV